ncbi:DUF5131 family protein [Candidatus Desulfatibia sp.]|uniref:DUF5131 family protein n=1 Tax=Candidatus Desulfatibia sp. TaxID=3101189 RepID=UPI0039B970B6
MSDTFHESVPYPFIQKLFQIMNGANWLTFQVLTRRAERLEELSPILHWTDNIWVGVSIENNDYVYRAEHLKKSGAFTKYHSHEPLLCPLPDLNLNGIDWVIVGGESGPKARPSVTSNMSQFGSVASLSL